MKNSQDPEVRNSKKGLWEIFLVREDGDWAGFRVGVQTLRRLSNFLVLILCLLSLSLMGWVFARWKMSQYKRDLSFTKLELSSVREELRGLQKVIGKDPTDEGSDLAAAEFEKENSFLPTLEARDRSSALISLENFTVLFESRAKKLELSFELERKPPREGPKSFYWVLLLHGPKGILSFPSAMTSRSGELILFHRGQLVDVKRPKEIVTAQFQVSSFVKESGVEPVYATLLLYDDKGSLVLRRRRGLEVAQ